MHGEHDQAVVAAGAEGGLAAKMEVRKVEPAQIGQRHQILARCLHGLDPVACEH